MSSKPTARPEDVIRANAVRDTWTAAVGWLQQKTEQGASLGDSLLSRIVGPEIPRPTLNYRHISCFGVDLEGQKVQEPCPNLQKSQNGTHHCGACGCGDTFLSQLEPGLKLSKLLYPRLNCPLKRRGFSNEFEDEDFDKRKRVVYFDAAYSGGLGDVIAVLWISMGYRDAGWDVKFLRTGSECRPCYDSVVEACGFELTDDRSEGVWRLGHLFPPYTNVELRVDQGKTNRLAIWSAWLPGSPIPRRPVLKIPKESWTFAHTQVERAAGKPIAVLAPVAHWLGRIWPLPYWYELSALLEKEGFHVVGVGGPPDEKYLTGFPSGLCHMSYLDTLALLHKSQLFVGNDSGPAWLNTLTDTPGIVVSGPMSNLYTHVPTMREVFSEEMPCIKCHCQVKNGYHLACDYGCQALMKTPPEQVFREAMSLLGREPCKTSSISSEKSSPSAGPGPTSRSEPATPRRSSVSLPVIQTSSRPA